MASEYGWAFEDILERVYLDDLFYLAKRIDERKISEYKMELAIVQNPHVKDPQQLWQLLRSEQEREKDNQFDAVGFEILKDRLRKNPRIIVK